MKIPDGYVALKAGDIKQKGDGWFSDSSGEWLTTVEIGVPVGQGGRIEYLRPIPTKKKQGIAIFGLTPALHAIVQPLFFAAGYVWIHNSTIIENAHSTALVGCKERIFHSPKRGKYATELDVTKHTLAEITAAFNLAPLKLGEHEITIGSDGSLSVMGHTVKADVLNEILHRFNEPITIGEHQVEFRRVGLKIGCQLVTKELLEAIQARR